MIRFVYFNFSFSTVVTKPTIEIRPSNNVVEKNISDDYTDTQRSNPLVASTVDDFIPEDNDYETFLVDDYTPPQQQNIAIGTLTKSSTKLSTTDEYVLSIY